MTGRQPGPGAGHEVDGVRHYVAGQTAAFERDWHFSHAVEAAGLIFLTGMTGATGADVSHVPPAEQFGNAFEQLGASLAAAGATFADIVELTTYHVGLRAHLAEFTAVKDRYLHRPYPAWSAIGVAELITPGTLVELRAIARRPA